MSPPDHFAQELAQLWSMPPDDRDTRVDWDLLGCHPDELDAPTVEALALLEPAAPRPWRLGAHPYQLDVARSIEPYVLFMAGRGAGKTYTASHTLAEWIEAEPGDYGIVAPTFGDAVAICADGPSGFIQAAGDLVERFNRNEYVIYMTNGSRVRLASADAPDRVRGWNFTGAWCDEIGSWKDTTVWYEGLEFAVRIGRSRRMLTTTPRRGNKILKEMMKRIDERDPDVRLVRASTYDNAANLSSTFLRTVEKQYAGTTLGLQELEGQLLADVEGSLIKSTLVEATRVAAAEIPDLWRVVVGVDPAVSNNEGSDHTGIVVMGIGPAPAGWTPPVGKVILADSPHLYLLQDASIKTSVESWARRVLEVADEWGADAIIGEKNNGGDSVETNVRLVARAGDLPMPNYVGVSASVGKKARAEPVASVWEQHRLHVLREAPGGTEKVEEEWTGWVPSETTRSPDRLDASAWAAIGLMPELSAKGQTAIRLLSAAS